MKCHSCQRAITTGAEERKRAEFWRQPDGSMKIFGINMPHGLLEKASGQLAYAMHAKCYHTVTKRQRRSDAQA